MNAQLANQNAQSHPPIDRDKSPLFDADHDLVRVADALRRSPHFAAADADPGGDTVWFTTEGGGNFTDDLLPEPVLTGCVGESEERLLARASSTRRWGCSECC
ncbi:hypothetical protein [Streptomyces sp. NPDC014734]|uniref:hypothetical protein n=1 Tax=Streptomyces sp. NPDC014734 TaxID=3364886 RepID=UPI0036F80DEF